MDYGCQFYGSAAKVHLDKIEQFKNKCLRISLGYLLKSTPISIMDPGSVEELLQYRRKLISQKFIARATSKEASYFKLVPDLEILVLKHKYWHKKITPSVIESYTSISNYRSMKYSSCKISSRNIQTYYFNLNKKFAEHLYEKWPEHYCILMVQK